MSDRPPCPVKVTKRCRMIERSETFSRPSFSISARLRVSVVRSTRSSCARRPIETGCDFATATRMANCVERTPEGCRAESYKFVTARAVLRRLKATQEAVPLKSHLGRRVLYLVFIRGAYTC